MGYVDMKDKEFGSPSIARQMRGAVLWDIAEDFRSFLTERTRGQVLKNWQASVIGALVEEMQREDGLFQTSDFEKPEKFPELLAFFNDEVSGPMETVGTDCKRSNPRSWLQPEEFAMGENQSHDAPRKLVTWDQAPEHRYHGGRHNPNARRSPG